jgi:hypothetical protein
MPRTLSGSINWPGEIETTWPDTRSATVGGAMSQVESVDNRSTSCGEKWS